MRQQAGGARSLHSQVELLERCRHGDRSAWSALVDGYERLVFSIPVRCGLGAEDSADITQATFAELLKQIDTIAEPDRLASWLMTVSRRLTWRRLEQHRIDRIIDRELSLEKSALDINCPHPDAVAQQLGLYEAIRELGEPCRTLIIALFFDPTEPSYEEIAELIGRPVGSIGPLRKRGLERLRSALEESK